MWIKSQRRSRGPPKCELCNTKYKIRQKYLPLKSIIYKLWQKATLSRRRLAKTFLYFLYVVVLYKWFKTAFNWLRRDLIKQKASTFQQFWVLMVKVCLFLMRVGLQDPDIFE